MPAHADFGQILLRIGHLNELAGVTDNQCAVLSLAQPGGDGGPEADLPAPELAEGFTAPVIDAALGGNQGAHFTDHFAQGECPDEGEHQQHDQSHARAAGCDGFFDTEGTGCDQRPAASTTLAI